MVTISNKVALHKRAQLILTAHGDQLQDERRSDDLVFLNALVNKNVFRGTEKHQQLLDELEAEFPIGSVIAQAQLDPDVSGCVKSNRRSS